MYDKKHILKEAEKHEVAAPLHPEISHEITDAAPSITEQLRHKDELRAQKLLHAALQRQLRISAS